MIFVVGVLIGSILGLTGAGGSVLALPLLIHFLHIAPHSAIGIALGAVAASAIFGVIVRLSRKEVAWLPGLLFAMIGAVLAPVGHFFANLVHEDYIVGGFSVLMIYVGIQLWRQTIVAPDEARTVRLSKHKESLPDDVLFQRVSGQIKINYSRLLMVCIGGAVTGLMSGFFGVGGGFIVVPILIFIAKISMNQAVGTSLFIVSMISSSGFSSYIVLNEQIPWPMLVQLALGGVAGMMLGTLLGGRLAGPTLQRFFASAVLTLAVLNFVKL